MPKPDSAAVEKIKVLRQNIAVVEAHILSFSNRSRYLSLAYTQTERAFMFCGKVLGAIGEPSPYPQGEDPASQVVDKPTDRPVAITIPEEFTSATPVIRLKKLRGTLQGLKDEAIALRGIVRNPKKPPYDEALLMMETVIVALTECRLWLGMEMSSIATEPA